MHKILAVKPHYVTLDEAKKAVGRLYSLYPGASITLVANLFPDDYSLAKEIIDVQEKILFGPHTERLNKSKLIQLLLNLRKRRFDKAFLFTGKPYEENYRKGKILIFFSGAKEIKLLDVHSGNENTLDLFGIEDKRNKAVKMLPLTLGQMFGLIWGIILLGSIAVSFLLFVVLPLKIRKITYR
ncbi:MAG: hypothetical protein WC723_02225 [Candidatus Omnitrophota bacterium]